MGASLPFLAPIFPARTFESQKFLASALSFASGVMVYASFVELLPEAKVEFTLEVGNGWASLCVMLAFLAGWIGIDFLDWLIDKCFSDSDGNGDGDGNSGGKGAFNHHHHHHHGIADLDDGEQSPVEKSGIRNRKPASKASSNTNTSSSPQQSAALKKSTHNDPALSNQLKKLGWQTALALFIHNIPEGIITFITCLSNVKFGVFVGMAVIIHNIPEGLSVALPIYYATGSKWQGFLYGGIFSGLGEPLGALLAYLIVFYNVDLSAFTWNPDIHWDPLQSPLPPLLSGLAYCMTAGTMANVVFQGLLPITRKLDSKDTVCSRSLLTGIALMMFSVHLLDLSFD